jgi:parvulin-like peptidyl-prolyl isomerase
MFLEREKMAVERKQRLLAGDNFTNMAGMLSLDPVTQSKGGYLGWVPKGYEEYAIQSLNSTAFKDVIFKMQPKEISDPIYDPNMEKQFGYWVLELLEKDNTKGVHARGILVATMDEAEDIKAKLKNGESFEALAKQCSQHSSKDKGGDFGWKVPGMEKGMLDRIIAALKPNEISEIIRDESVKTKGGWWVVQVIDKQADRPLDEAIREKLADKCLSEWVNEQAKNAKINVQMDQAQMDWAADRVIKSRGK